MNSNSSDPRSVRFGVFEVDFAAAELRKRGRRVKLEAQPFQVLSVLMRRPGELVSREELRKEVWPEDTFVEFDHSLNTAVKKIRQALDDSPQNPRYIETAPRQGYRFIAAVDVGTPAPPATQTESLPPPKSRRRLWYVVGAAAFAIALVLAARPLSRIVTPSPDQTGSVLTPIPLTSYPGWEGQPSLSPDGSQVAFTWNGPEEDNFDIYVKVIGSEEAHRLTGFPGQDITPAWSPDNRYIAFVRRLEEQDDGRGAIYLISPLRGHERKLAEIRSPAHFSWSPDLSWSPDAKWLAFSDKISPSEPRSIFIISPETLERRRLTSPQPGSGDHFAPAFSPDGSKLLFENWTGAISLMLAAFDEDYRVTEGPRTLFSGGYGAGWLLNSREIVYSADGPLRRMSVSGAGSTLTLPFEGGSVGVSHRGGRLVFEKQRFNTDLRRIAIPRLEDGPVPQSEPGVRIASSTYVEEMPAYSVDGSKIAFISWRSGSAEVWVSEPDGSNPVKLTSVGGDAYVGGKVLVVRWHPDNRSLLFTADGRPGVFRVASRGGRVETLMPENTRSVPVWSSDRRWIYISRTKNSQSEIWKVPAAGGEEVRITADSIAPQLSPDGRTLYFLRDEGDGQRPSLWRVPADGGQESQVLPLVWRSNYVVAGDGVYFITGDGIELKQGTRKPGEQIAGTSIQFLDFKTGRVRELAQLDRSAGWGLAVSPDGREILYSRWEQMGSDLMLVENFR